MQLSALKCTRCAQKARCSDHRDRSVGKDRMAFDRGGGGPLLGTGGTSAVRPTTRSSIISCSSEQPWSFMYTRRASALIAQVPPFMRAPASPSAPTK